MKSIEEKKKSIIERIAMKLASQETAEELSGARHSAHMSSATRKGAHSNYGHCSHSSHSSSKSR